MNAVESSPSWSHKLTDGMFYVEVLNTHQLKWIETLQLDSRTRTGSTAQQTSNSRLDITESSQTLAAIFLPLDSFSYVEGTTEVNAHTGQPHIPASGTWNDRTEAENCATAAANDINPVGQCAIPSPLLFCESIRPWPFDSIGNLDTMLTSSYKKTAFQEPIIRFRFSPCLEIFIRNSSGLADACIRQLRNVQHICKDE